MIDQFTRQFTEQKLLHIEKIGREYYQIGAELKELMVTADRNLNRNPISAGLYMGMERGKRFYPSLALLDTIGRVTERWNTVDDKAEWLFLCGRDVFAGSVVKANVRHGLVLVANKRKEVLGYGKIVGDPDKSDSVFIKNILDKGDYLRREMKR